MATLPTTKADKLLAQADKKANKFDWFGLSKSQNMGDAAELYSKAAAQYKILKEYAKAGECYEKAAKCNMGADNEIEAKQCWRDAGKCFRHVDYKRAISAYKHAIQFNLDANRFGQAAKLEEEIGDMLAEDDHFDEAIQAYEQSADYYGAENDNGNKNKRLLKVAHMCGKAKRWEKAIKIFEDTAKSSVDNNLLRWKVKEYLFKCMLLQINLKCDEDATKKVDWKSVGMINERYCDVSDIYASSRECKLIVNILETMPTNIQDFKDSIAAHDKISRLDAWCTQLLLGIQEYMEQKTTEEPFDELLGNSEQKDNYNDNQTNNNYNNNNSNNNYDNNYNSNNNNNNNNANVKNQQSPFDNNDLSNAPDLDDL